MHASEVALNSTHNGFESTELHSNIRLHFLVENAVFLVHFVALYRVLLPPQSRVMIFLYLGSRLGTAGTVPSNALVEQCS